MRRITVFAALLMALVSTSLFSSQPTQCAERCDTVKSLCAGQADMLNELCKAQGGSTQSCMSDFLAYYSQCMLNNDCPVNY